MRYEGNDYVRIYHHNVTKKVFFDKVVEKTYNQVSYINETDRFSVLGSINHLFYIVGKYNFLFHNPDEFPTDVLLFNQSTHPLFSNQPKDFSYKFKSKNALYTANNQEFEGLGLQDSGGCLIDGNPSNSNYNYCIGAKEPYGSDNTIPGIPVFVNGKYVPAHTNEIYIRIKNYKMIDLLPSLVTKIRCTIAQNNICYSNHKIIYMFVFGITK